MQPQQIAEMYELESGHWWFWGKRLVMRRLLGDTLKRPGLRILDIGCGAGANALELSAYGDVTASDRSLDALAFVRSRGVGNVVAAEAPRLPFADGAFDVVTAYDVIEHVEDDQGFVRELARVLAPGGSLAIHVPAWPFLWSGHDVSLEHKRRYTRRSLRELVESSGLRLEAAAIATTGLPVGVSLAAIAKRKEEVR